MDFLLIVFSCDKEHATGIRIVSEPGALARYRNAEMQHERRLAAASVSCHDRNRAIGDHVLHDPPSLRRGEVGEARGRDYGQLGELARFLFWRRVLNGRRRRLGAIIVIFALWRGRRVEDGEPGLSSCPFLPVALGAPRDRGRSKVAHSVASCERAS